MPSFIFLHKICPVLFSCFRNYKKMFKCICTHTHKLPLIIVTNTTFHIIQPLKFMSRKQTKIYLPLYYYLQSLLELSITIMGPIYKLFTKIKRNFPTILLHPQSRENTILLRSFLSLDQQFSIGSMP